MAIPDYQTMMLPVLQASSEGEITVSACIDYIARRFGLSDDDLNEMLNSGRQTRLANRVHWATTYLAQAGLVERTGRGRFRATDRGLKILHENPGRIDNRYLERFEEFQAFLGRRGSKAAATRRNADPTPINEASVTPEEAIEAAYEEIAADLRDGVGGAHYPHR